MAFNMSSILKSANVPTTASTVKQATQQSVQQPQVDIASLISQEFAKQNQAQQQQQSAQQQNILAEIEKAKAARIASRNAALSGVLSKTQSNLAAEKQTIAPQYQTLKNNESSTAQLRAKRVGEIMASKGYSEGYQGQDEIASNVEYQGNIGNYKAQEQNAYNDIAKRGTDAQTEYQTGLATAQADADVAANEQRLAELGTERNYAREDAQTQYDRSQDTIANNRTAEQDKIAAEDKQKQEFVATIGQYYKDYTQAINDIANDNDTTNDWQLPYLKAARAEKVAAQDAAQATAKVKAIADKNAATKLAYEQAFERWNKAGKVLTQADANILGISVGTKTQQATQDQMSNSIAQQNANTSRASVGVSQQNANTNSAQLTWAKDPTNPDNIAKTKMNTNTTNTVDDYSSAINRLYVTSPNTNNNYTASQDTQGIKAYIDTLIQNNVDPSIINSLAARYGIK